MKVMEGQFQAHYQDLEWTPSLAGQDGVFLLRYAPAFDKR